jgi:hypothetical protein
VEHNLVRRKQHLTIHGMVCRQQSKQRQKAVSIRSLGAFLRKLQLLRLRRPRPRLKHLASRVSEEWRQGVDSNFSASYRKHSQWPSCSRAHGSALSVQRRIQYCTCKLLDSMPQFVSSTGYIGIDLGLQISAQRKEKPVRIQVRWSPRPPTCSFASATVPVSRIFWQPVKLLA